MAATKHLHNQYPTSEMSDEDFETAESILAEQIAAQIDRYCPEGEAIKAANDMLTNEFRPGLTIQEWLAAACRRLGIDPAACAGL
jgi:hypothetical protein